MGGIFGGKPDTSASRTASMQREQTEKQEARMREQQTEEAQAASMLRARRRVVLVHCWVSVKTQHLA